MLSPAYGIGVNEHRNPHDVAVERVAVLHVFRNVSYAVTISECIT